MRSTRPFRFLARSVVAAAVPFALTACTTPMNDASTPKPTAAAAADFAPTGTLRASINLGNPILAKRDAAGEPAGVSVDLARGLAAELKLPLELLVFDTAAASVDAVKSGRADVGFFAVDPLRGDGIRFSAPYVLIEGAYLVRDGSPLRDNAEVDRAGLRVVVGKGSAYDLYLSRELKAAEIVRAPTSPAVVDHFIAVGADVAAGVKQQLQADAARLPGMRLLPGRFMVIEQAMGVNAARGDAAHRALRDYVERAKAGGEVERLLQRHGVKGAAVAPPG